MRKIIAIFLCLCLTIALLASCGAGSIRQYEGEEAAGDAEPTEEPQEAAEDDAEPAEEPEEAADDAEPTDEPEEEAEDDAEPTAEPTPSPKPGLGYAAYDPDQVVMTYNGLEATWREYYYWLNYYAGYVRYLAAMGAPFSGWDGSDYDPEMDNASLVRTSAADGLFQYRAVEVLAEEDGLTLTQEDKDSMQEAFEQAADSYGDGDGTCTDQELSDYEEYLDGQFMSRELLDHLSGVSLLSDKLLTARFGKDGENISDEDVLAYAEELGLLACKHILLMTIDPETNEELSDQELEQKKAQADELYEQLAAVQDDPEKLEELFDQLMNEYSEDTGLTYNPDGYQFVSGVMVPVFEETTASLEEYGLSQPVQSDYGYHIILRLPVDPNGTYTASGGSTAALRTAAANQKLLELLQDTTANADIVWKDDFEQVDIEEIFGE